MLLKLFFILIIFLKKHNVKHLMSYFIFLIPIYLTNDLSLFNLGSGPHFDIKARYRAPQPSINMGLGRHTINGWGCTGPR